MNQTTWVFPRGGGGLALRVEGSLVLRPGEEESFPVEVLAPCPVRAAVEAPGLTVYLAPNLAQGSAYLRVRAHLGTPPGNYRVPLPGGGGPFHLEGSGPEPYRLLAFQNWGGDGLLDPEEPQGEAETTPPATGVRMGNLAWPPPSRCPASRSFPPFSPRPLTLCGPFVLRSWGVG